MKIELPSDHLITLPDSIKKYLREASAAELKVLLYLYAWKQAEIPELASQLGITPADAESAIAFWRGAGLIHLDDSAEKKPVPASTSLYKSYDSETIHNALNNENFKACCDLIGERFKKQLTKNDYSSLVYLSDYVGLPPEVLSGIAEYCVSNGKPSMQYFMKTALGMYEQDGIDTYEKFERHIAHIEQVNSTINQVKKLCGMGDRALSTKESTILHRWFDEWNISMDLVSLAYDKTIDSIGKVNLPYMNTIIKRWYENGFQTPDDVKNLDKLPDVADHTPGYGDRDEFFEAALKAGFKDD